MFARLSVAQWGVGRAVLASTRPSFNALRSGAGAGGAVGAVGAGTMPAQRSVRWLATVAGGGGIGGPRAGAGAEVGTMQHQAQHDAVRARVQQKLGGEIGERCWTPFVDDVVRLALREKMHDDVDTMADAVTGLSFSGIREAADLRNVAFEETEFRSRLGKEGVSDAIAELLWLRFVLDVGNTPVALVSSSGAEWEYQGGEQISEVLVAPLEALFTAWATESSNIEQQPLFACFDAGGLGKSRLGQEFPRLCQDACSADTPLGARLRGDNVLTFNIKLNKDEGSRDNTSFIAAIEPVTSGESVIGRRMLAQLLGVCFNEDFCAKTATVRPEEVLEMAARAKGVPVADLTAFIIVDGVDAIPAKQQARAVCASVARLGTGAGAFVVPLVLANRFSADEEDVLGDCSGPSVSIRLAPLDWRNIFPDLRAEFPYACEDFGESDVHNFLKNRGGRNGARIEGVVQILRNVRDLRKRQQFDFSAPSE